MSCKSKCYRGICLLITVSFISLSCSITGNVFKKINLWDDAKSLNALDNKRMKKFVSSVRAPLGNPDSHYRLASYYQERNRHKEAIEEFKKIILIDPGNVKAYNGIGVSFDQIGYTYRAIDYYEKALDLNPELDYVLNNLGYAFIRLGKYDQAVDVLRRAVELDQGNERFHNNLGLAYAKQGKFDLALNEFILSGDDVKAHYNIGQVYYEKGLYDEAKVHFQKALNINPSFLMARVWLELADSMTISDHLSIENADQGKGSDESLQFYESDENKVNQPVDADKLSPSDMMEDTEHAGRQKSIHETVSYEGIGIEISNGNGVNRMARKVGNYLGEKGFEVVRLTNAESFTHAETLIYYRGEYQEAANEIAKHIPGHQNVGKVQKLDSANVNIKVLIGKDIIKFNDIFAGG